VTDPSKGGGPSRRCTIDLLILEIGGGLAALGAAFACLRLRRRALRAEHRLLAIEAFDDRFPGAALVFDRRLRHVRAWGRDLPAIGDAPEGKTLAELVPCDVLPILEPAYRAALEGTATRIDLPFGDRDWLVTVSALGEETGILVALDVTDHKRRERQLAELATRDALTGLWNRRRLTEELDWLARGDRPGTVLVLDLDGFKQVNDRLGHEAGDELLRRVAQVVSGCVRRADVVARLGGDEFAVLLMGATPEDAARVSESIERAVEAIWPIGVRGGVSVGIASVGLGATEALSRADRAMYAKKRAA
jgi:diguanylate cyclase